MKLPSVDELVTKCFEWDWSKKLVIPDKASGQCYLSTKKILNYYQVHEELPVAFARHYNDPEGRYLQYGQYSNHYAIWHPEEKLVVDFTMRQFSPTSAFPWVGTYSEWLRKLAKAWGVSSVKHLTRSRGILCPDCAQVNCNPYDCIGNEE